VAALDIEDRKRAENVRLEERARVARELHDTLLQTVQSAVLYLCAALYEVSPDSPVKPRLEWILQLLSQGIEEGRSAIQGLRSSDSSTMDLVVALSGVHQELSVQPDIDFRVSVRGRQQPLNPSIRQEMYRIGREALLDAFRHSRAKRVEFELAYADQGFGFRACGSGPIGSAVSYTFLVV
jgi:signal transduction histidine kinase